MSLDAVSIIMAGASLVSLGILIAALDRARIRRDLDASTALTLGMGIAGSLPVAIVAIAGGVVRRPDAVGQLATFYPSWYTPADTISKLLLLVLVSVLLLGRLLARRVVVHAAGLSAIGLWTSVQLGSLYHGGARPTMSSVALLACLIAATVVPLGRGACLGAGTFGIVLAIAGGLLGLFRHDVAFIVPCRGACSGLGFTGVLPNENLLGVSLAAAMPFVYLGFRGRTRVWFVLYLACMAAATGSRTAIVASLITLVALLVIRPSVDADALGPFRKALAWVVLLSAVTSSIVVLRLTGDSTALTGRPQLWDVASSYIHRSPWIGWGPTWWQGLYASSEIPEAAQRSSHNLWMDVLFVGGVVGAVFFVGSLIAVITSAGRARTGAIVGIATIFMIGTTEGVWAVGTFDFASFSFIALLLLGAGTARPYEYRPLDASRVRQDSSSERRLAYPRAQV
jgi:O-antigen ligase